MVISRPPASAIGESSVIHRPSSTIHIFFRATTYQSRDSKMSSEPAPAAKAAPQKSARGPHRQLGGRASPASIVSNGLQPGSLTDTAHKALVSNLLPKASAYYHPLDHAPGWHDQCPHRPSALCKIQNYTPRAKDFTGLQPYERLL